MQQHQSNKPQQRLLTEAEVSTIINFKRTKIWQMVKNGEFPAPIKFGRWNRWHIADVEQWTDQQRENRQTAA